MFHNLYSAVLYFLNSLLACVMKTNPENLKLTFLFLFLSFSNTEPFEAWSHVAGWHRNKSFDTGCGVKEQNRKVASVWRMAATAGKIYWNWIFFSLNRNRNFDEGRKTWKKREKYSNLEFLWISYFIPKKSQKTF